MRLPMCNERFGSPMIPFFHPMLHPCEDGHWYLAEDYAFCQRARQCGFKIMADTDDPPVARGQLRLRLGRRRHDPPPLQQLYAQLPRPAPPGSGEQGRRATTSHRRHDGRGRCATAAPAGNTGPAYHPCPTEPVALPSKPEPTAQTRFTGLAAIERLRQAQELYNRGA